jgi:hypothetical protein
MFNMAARVSGVTEDVSRIEILVLGGDMGLIANFEIIQDFLCYVPDSHDR